MKIAIDYTPGVRQIAGVGRYTRSLVQALIHTAPDDSYTLLYAGAAPSIPLSAGVEEESRRDGGAVTLRRLPVPERLLTVMWHRWRVPFWADLCSAWQRGVLLAELRPAAAAARQRGGHGP